MLALHLITITPDTAWVSRTRRVILLQEEMIFKSCDYLLIIPAEADLCDDSSRPSLSLNIWRSPRESSFTRLPFT